MKGFILSGATVAVACLAMLTAQTAHSEETGPALTVYNQNFAVVRDHVEFELVEGTNRVTFAGVTTSLEPDRAAKFVAEVSYVTGGFTWKADYNLVVPEEGDKFKKTDASTAEFRVKVPAEGSTTVKHTVHYWWRR